MGRTLQRICYDRDPLCRVHYTAGYTDGSVALRQFHYDTALIIDYFPRGHGDIRIEGRLYSFAAGDMILLTPSELHLCTIAEEEEFERITLHISERIPDAFGGGNPAFFSAFYERERGTGNLIRADRLHESGADSLMEDILAYARGDSPVAPVLLRCKVLELLAKIGETADRKSPPNESPHIENELITDIVRYLNTHYREELSLSDIAERFYHSKYHICHLFKECMGISVHDYIAWLRIRLVNDRIRQGDSIADACYLAGFRNYSNFFRIYKKHTGLTPQQFKNSAENGSGTARY